MQWKQFFTPVTSIDALNGQELVARMSLTELTILDVRQPTEYEQGHIPGATLIPLPDLGKRLGELAPDKTILVY